MVKLLAQHLRAADFGPQGRLGQDGVQPQRGRLPVQDLLTGHPGGDALVDRFRVGLAADDVDLAGVPLGLE